MSALAHARRLRGVVATGLQYVHSQLVLHRDIKGANMLVSNSGRLKICDFGLSREFQTKDMCDERFLR